MEIVVLAVVVSIVARAASTTESINSNTKVAAAIVQMAFEDENGDRIQGSSDAAVVGAGLVLEAVELDALE